ncbi:MAG: GNAT family N-acetyltransferase [Dethiobacter sp.]|jgi:predicted N-acetyltransferase YhbS|nr:GNAT family N-acetyltransferase [Dethiobacter sp.]
MAIVRKATLDDREKTIALLKSFPPDPELPDVDWNKAADSFAPLVEGNGGCIFIAEEDNEIVGVITLGFSYVLRFGGRYAMIEEFIVSEKMRGRGIANPLIQAAIEEARSNGCPEIQVNGPSPLGHPVYIRNGFHDAGIHMKLRF